MSSLRQQDRDLTTIAGLQKYDGSFVLNQNLASTIGLSLSTLQQEAQGKGWDPNAWATVVVLAYFVAKLGNIQTDWELLSDKSKSWLNHRHENVTEDMFEAALKLFP